MLGHGLLNHKRVILIWTDSVTGNGEEAAEEPLRLFRAFSRSLVPNHGNWIRRLLLCPLSTDPP